MKFIFKAKNPGGDVRLEYSNKKKQHSVTAYHKKTGKMVGYAYFVQGPDHLSADDRDGDNASWVHPDHRGKGLANKMYDHVERKSKKQIIPAEHRSGAGDKFWDKRAKHLPEDHPAHEFL